MRRYLLFMGILFCFLSNIKAQDTEFWFVAPDVAETHDDRPVFFVFSNPNKNVAASVRFTVQGGVPAPGAAFDTTFVLSPSGYSKIEFNNAHATRQVSMVENPDRLAGNPADYGIHITSDVKIMAYYKVDANSQRDVFVLKGKPALGLKFITPFHEQAGNYYVQANSHPTMFNMGADQIDIVATEDGTVVTVNLTKDCLEGNAGNRLFASANPHTFSLNKGQTLKLREDTIIGTATSTPNIDIAITKNTGTLAGTTITSNIGHPIAVTQAEDCITPTENPGAVDLAGDQLVPVEMLGKRFVVTKVTHTAIDERVDFLATVPNTTVTVYYYDSGNNLASTSQVLANVGDMWHVAMNDLPGSSSSNITVEASEPIYCFQHVGGGNSGCEVSGALIPSVYSIGAQKIDFYQSEHSNYGYLVYRVGEDTAFYYSVDGGAEAKLPLSWIQEKGPLPNNNDLEFMRIRFSGSGTNNKMVTMRNGNSPFSLSILNAHQSNGVSSFGYMSGFGNWEFDPDTIWRCPSGGGSVTLTGPYAKSYKWTLPDGSIKTTPSIKAYAIGRYILEVDQDPNILKDTCYILPMNFGAEINMLPRAPKPAKVGVPQQFNVSMRANRSSVSYKWTFEGGSPATATFANPSVIWRSTGEKKVTVTITAQEGSGNYLAQCDTTIEMSLIVKSKHNGYFVNQNTNSSVHDGSSWATPFITIQDALEVASQGDYIWVAKGVYKPWADQSYVMDYDSVMVYGGFNGTEANLSERNFATNPTILQGNGTTVIKIVGGTQYSNSLCGTTRAAGWDGFTIQGGKAQDRINGSSGNGGGILFTNGANATIANCIIKSNRAEKDGGGIYLSAPTICTRDSSLFYNNEISGNIAATGGGVYNAGSDASFMNVTISGNSATGAGGFANSGGDPSIYNSIIWGNGPSDDETDIVNSGGTPVYAYSVLGGSKGSGTDWDTSLGTDQGKNLDAGPLFRKKGFDNFGNMQQGTYKLSGQSNSVNTGRTAMVSSGYWILRDINLLSPANGTYSTFIYNDLSGGERVYTDIVDRGAYEYNPMDIGDPDIKHLVHIGTYQGVSTIPAMGDHYAYGHGDFTVIFTPEPGYSLRYAKVTTGSASQDEEGGAVLTHNADGSLKVVFRQITSALDIKLTDVTPVGNELFEKESIWTYKNNLYVKTSGECVLKIYTLTGELLREQVLQSGDYSFSLPQGLYIVTLNDGIKRKVVIN